MGALTGPVPAIATSPCCPSRLSKSPPTWFGHASGVPSRDPHRVDCPHKRQEGGEVRARRDHGRKGLNILWLRNPDSFHSFEEFSTAHGQIDD